MFGGYSKSEERFTTSQIDVHGFSWLTPTLQCESANETESPVLSDANGLEFSSSADDFIHDERLSARSGGIDCKPS